MCPRDALNQVEVIIRMLSALNQESSVGRNDCPFHRQDIHVTF